MIGGVTRRGSSPVFVGRRAELDRLEAALAAATGGQPSTVLIAGEAGVGKSRFAAEFAAIAEAAGAISLTGGCLDLGEGGLPYAPFVEALRTLSRRLDPETAEAVFGPSMVELGGLLPDLRTTMRLSALDDRIDPSGRMARLFDAFFAALGRASRVRPVVLVIEDVHWADGSTRDLIRFLVRNVRDERLLVLVTYRSDDLHRRHPVMPLLAELGRADRVERLELRRFDRDELTQQLHGILGQAPPPARIDALFERSDGLPFYVEELLAGAEADGSILPSSLREILELRLANLSTDALRLVRAAAVIGGRWPHDRIATLTGMGDDALLAGLREATEAGVLVSIDGHAGPTYTFRHALLREAAYDELLPAERIRLHGRLVDELSESIRGDPDPGSGDRRGYRGPRVPRPRPPAGTRSLGRGPPSLRGCGRLSRGAGPR